MNDTTAPETTVDSGPEDPTTVMSATFTFSANEPGVTFACSLDGVAFVACTSPVELTGLGLGAHTFAVQATDHAGNTDPTPASYSWTVVAQPPPPTCTVTTETLTASADAWLEQNSPSNNKGADSTLKVQSKGPADNYRALVRFALPTSVPPGCMIESATLRMYAASSTTGRILQALRIDGVWLEDSVTWDNQPATAGAAATTSSENGYREWEVTVQVQAMYDTDAKHGFLIRDAVEGDSGYEQQFHSREKGETPPELVVVYAQEPSGSSSSNESGEAEQPGATYLPIISDLSSRNADANAGEVVQFTPIYLPMLRR
jgi:hypothetical protein